MSGRNSASPASLWQIMTQHEQHEGHKGHEGHRGKANRVVHVHKESFVLCVLGVLCVGVGGCGSRPSPSAAPPRLGFSSAAFDKERDLEQRLRAGVSADQISTFHKMVTREPHMA